jgi:hypothetical protein
MRSRCLLALLGCFLLVLLPACDVELPSGEEQTQEAAEAVQGAEAGEEGSQEGETAADEPEDEDEPESEGGPGVHDRLDRGREAFGDAVAGASERAERWIKETSENPLRGWATVVLATLFGLLMLLFGWALVKSFMIPFAPVWGLILGGFVTFSLIRTFQSGAEWQLWHRVVIMGAGALFGVAVFMFAALRAKPIAALLVVISPFLIVATFVAGTNVQWAIAIFFIGFVAGFAAMVQVRPISIISTSLFGALSLLIAYAVGAYLMFPPVEPDAEGQLAQTSWMVDSVQWLLENPLMALLAVCIVAFLGVNFQFATGPRGGLEK